MSVIADKCPNININVVDKSPERIALWNSSNLELLPIYEPGLDKIIARCRDKNLTFNQIAEELNKKGYLSAKGKVFKGNHVHSIVKKKRLRDEKFYRKYLEEWSDISFEVVDKSLVNMFEN